MIRLVKLDSWFPVWTQPRLEAAVPRYALEEAIMAETKKGMKSDLDRIAQVLTGATMLIVDYRNGTIRPDGEPARVQRILDELHDCSMLIYGE